MEWSGKFIILAHALDHLALLNCCDESIKSVLETGWLETLATRLPKPAGYLARGKSTVPGDGVGVDLSPEKEEAWCAIVDRYDDRYEDALAGREYPA